ncbi:MAG: hypothetical protein M1834_004504 [Cirrosporium novae-zelandiae]|nr:MAG: hypothetical protein M1834_004504 [Cirrosporium novae-zelandiae]
MKYGDTFAQWSIPEWANYNVDYNEIKRFIKDGTTKTKKPVSIPGRFSQEDRQKAFEDEFYTRLLEQHEQVNLFVKSKSGEIRRRLEHIGRLLSCLLGDGLPKDGTPISIRRIERFGKIEELALNIGEEIKKLAQFVAAQRLAFQKLLKKYIKWTGSNKIGSRFRRTALDKPTSFSRIDLDPLLQQFAEVLNAVQAPFITGGVSWRANSDPHLLRTSVNSGKVSTYSIDFQEVEPTGSLLQAAFKGSSEVEFDACLATVPLGRSSGRAVYWVHQDNIVQVQVLLVQHMRIRPSVSRSRKNSLSGSVAHGQRLSRRSSISVLTGNTLGPSADNLSMVILDDLQRFSNEQNGLTISDFEDTAGRCPENAAVSIRWGASGEALVHLSPKFSNDESTEHAPQTIKINRKNIPKFLDVDYDAVQELISSDDQEPEIQRVKNWLASHQEIRPLVVVRSIRTRFSGLKNEEDNGVWAALDQDVKMMPPYPELLGSSHPDSISQLPQNEVITFPHAVLDVRWEGGIGKELVDELDNSYLVKRIRGFSLETHAIATVCKLTSTRNPLWIDSLDTDIRKVPSRNPSFGNVASQIASNSSRTPGEHTPRSATSTSAGPSTAVFSAPEHDSSTTSDSDHHGDIRFCVSSKKATKPMPISIPYRRVISDEEGYWNELTHGEDVTNQDVYTIYTDPNVEIFPGWEAMSRFFTSIASRLNRSTMKVKRWLNITEPHPLQSGEADPLLDDEQRPISDHSTDVADADIENLHRRYGTLPHTSHNIIAHLDAQLSRETAVVFYLEVVCFSVSFVLDFVATVLKMTGRRKEAVPVDIGVCIATTASLFLAVSGLGLMLNKRDRLSWIHHIAVMLAFGMGRCHVPIQSGLLQSVKKIAILNAGLPTPGRSNGTLDVGYDVRELTVLN